MTGGGAAVLRFFLAAVLLVTSAAKLLDVRGFADVLETYRAFPQGALLPLAVAIPAAELLLGVWLLSGKRLFEAGLVATLLNLGYAGWSAAAVLRGLKLANCGCFGVFLKRPLGWTTVVEDLLLAGTCAFLAALARPSGDRRSTSAA